ncbi:MAG: DEAD/DEAH box helicase, partial [Fibrobacterota bacterium]|nr:DEAD/DEAH box helicase [Fibrobacterota bacterium]
QAQALPLALKGNDLIAQAKTGSGKTAAFGIPLLHKIDLKSNDTQALIICPTRELSIQVSNEIRLLARYRNNVKVVTLYGGQAMGLQKASLKLGAHIIVGTPGRIKALIEREILSLKSLTTLVLDEADRMLEMGFMDDVIDIIAATPNTRQTLLFSATFPENIQSLSARFQKTPSRVDVEAQKAGEWGDTGNGGPAIPSVAAGHSEIEQIHYACGATGKLEAVVTLLTRIRPQSTLIFCNTKIAAKEVFEYLLEKGFSVATLHGDLEQRDREQVLMLFRHQGCRVLVATDVAARGLDIEDLSAVINFESPHDQEAYVHRIGRTGRAGRTGQAFTLFSPAEKFRLDTIRHALGLEVPIEAIAAMAGKNGSPLVSEKVTLSISGGRKDKIRAGDILGALTGEKGIEGKAVGKIDVMDYDSYVTVDRQSAKRAFTRLSDHKIKGRKYKVRFL